MNGFVLEREKDEFRVTAYRDRREVGLDVVSRQDKTALCANVTPAEARRIAHALLRAANEVEEP